MATKKELVEEALAAGIREVDGKTLTKATKAEITAALEARQARAEAKGTVTTVFRSVPLALGVGEDVAKTGAVEGQAFDAGWRTVDVVRINQQTVEVIQRADLMQQPAEEADE